MHIHALFLGDSFTDGLWVNDADTFVNVYGHIVRERAGVKLCPVNAGVNGYGSLEEAYLLEHDFESAGRPRWFSSCSLPTTSTRITMP